MARVSCRIDDPRWRALAGMRALARRAVRAALAESGRRAPVAAEVTIVLTDDSAVRALNAHWRGKDKPTNVLSFPASERVPEALGDVVLAYETVQREADAEGKTAADHAAHLIVHGMLHLLGFDHANDRAAVDMEAREIAAVARLGLADPYAGTSPVDEARDAAA